VLENLGGDHRVKGLKPEMLDEPFRRQNNVDVLVSLYIDSDDSRGLQNLSINGLTLPFTNLLPISNTLLPANSPQSTDLTKKSITATFIALTLLV
jgi:hypothetical protein